MNYHWKALLANGDYSRTLLFFVVKGMRSLFTDRENHIDARKQICKTPASEKNYSVCVDASVSYSWQYRSYRSLVSKDHTRKNQYREETRNLWGGPYGQL
ncbi:hypothetical protein MKW98_019938 [Papaver atlanticum]|uniref:Uncharacterized protein n=1 Tax=Papaver atlanticum TaxID=357466 RepID=A0AAD4X679_9MAGN|nr:hypothetical protein MKW98_019938 [Papaver atlanticum]